MSKLIYLASPYSHPKPEMRQWRFEKTAQIACAMIKKGYLIFSPICHSHPIALCGLDGDWDFWQKFDIEFLGKARLMIIACLPGWKQSKGINSEIDIAKRLYVPVCSIIEDEIIKMIGDYRKDKEYGEV